VIGEEAPGARWSRTGLRLLRRHWLRSPLTDAWTLFVAIAMLQSSSFEDWLAWLGIAVGAPAGRRLARVRRPLRGARLEAGRDDRADRLHRLVTVAPRGRNRAPHLTSFVAATWSSGLRRFLVAPVRTYWRPCVPTRDSEGTGGPPSGRAPHPLTHTLRVLRGAPDEGLHRRGLREARAVHGPASAGSGLRGGRRVPGAKRGEARHVQGAHHRRSGCDGRPRGHQARGRGQRRRARRARPARRPRIRDGHGPGGARSRACGVRLVFSCGWHITLDGQDVYSWKLKALVKIAGPLARLARFADLDD
jgi:hypothetical protein